VSVPAAGFYNVAKQLAGVVRKLNSVYASAAFPEISNLSAHRNDTDARQVRNKLLRAGMVIGILAVAVALIAGRPVLELLFGPAFAAAWIPLVILTAAAAGQMTTHTLSIYVQVYVGPGALLRAYLIAVVPFLLAVVPLTYSFSMAGTAGAHILFALALAFACIRTLRRSDAA
jgi:O-antigen/teichoic acid export membrane protein